MQLAAYCIARPIATSLLSFALLLAGLLAWQQLPVAPLPQVDFPTISVQASLPGASPETMAANVATPLERTLGTIAGVTEITSSSSSGATSITLQFALERDIDGAARDVQAAINAASNLLPPGMPSRPSYRKVNPADSPIMILGLTSTSQSRAQMYDVASTTLAQKIAQIPGIGQVNVSGSSLPAIRIELNPLALAKYQLSLAEVRQAIVDANVQQPKGVLEDQQQQWQLALSSPGMQAQDYLSLIIGYRNGAAIRLADVGHALDSAEDLRNAGYINDKPAVLLMLFKQSGANIIATVDRVIQLLPQLQAATPDNLSLTVALDRSSTIRASLREVEHSLLIAIALVIVGVLIFLGNWRATLIPVITVPLSLMGTLAGMYLCAYSLDNLSLMALTIATGFVVDDAIVVLENSMRQIEEGVAPRQAAFNAAQEVGFTILSMSLSLVAVFIPILFMDGIVGRLFQEFALTLAMAVMVSLVLALTTTPMLCALLLKPHVPQQPGFAQSFHRNWFQHLNNAYGKSLAWALQHPRFIMLLLAAAIGLNIYLYQIVPKGFFPIQDTGRLSGIIQADQSISSSALQAKLVQFVEQVSKDPEVSKVLAFSGGSGGSRLSNNAQMFVILKPLEQRKLSMSALQERLRRNLGHLPGAKLLLQPVQELRVGGRGASAMFEYTLQSEQLSDLRRWMPEIVKTLGQRAELADVNTDQQDKGQQISLTIDRIAAARVGVSLSSIASALNDAFGQRQVAVLYGAFNQYHIILEVAAEFAQNAQALNALYIKTPPSPEHPQGVQIPLSSLASYQINNTALTVNHQGQTPAASFSFNLKPDISLSLATSLIQEVMDELGVSASVRGSFQGTAKAFQQSLSNQPWLIMASILIIYIVLGMLYESYIHPLTILSTLPSAGVGAILALLLFNTEFTLIALIGVILLIGIVKKNAIMMIDFALQAQRQQQLSAPAAIYQACLLRFRPIMMTTFAALFAALPLALGSGYGAELRRPLGIAIMGGLVFSQILTLYTTPVVYLYLDRWQTWCQRNLSRVFR